MKSKRLLALSFIRKLSLIKWLILPLREIRVIPPPWIIGFRKWASKLFPKVIKDIDLLHRTFSKG